MDELATVLRRERWLLSVLLFRLTEMRHLLAANDSRFLGWASAEVEDAVARVREAELIRNALVSRLAREMEMPEDDLTLSSLARVAPEPYRQIFSEHRTAFLELVNEVQSVSQTNRRLATKGIQGLNEVLSMLNEEPDVHMYGPNENASWTRTAAPSSLDQSL
ncbi:MAG TPA: flagellar export chaperone FlgN [Acidimicrobiales bacterium]|nr:flagellar export chaperone FlgN [Acidimicrobiales bacterium]HVV35370.1 flagellar export chaperone FlgN [Acidimicrobiales bacterium]